MYTCICDETMITSRKGFSGSVTNACRMWVVIGSDDPAVDAEQLVHLRPLGHRDHGAVGMREGQMPLLREQEVEVQLCSEPFVELYALAVELGSLGRSVVRSDDRRIAPGRAGADVALLEDRDIGDAVVLR